MNHPVRRRLALVWSALVALVATNGLAAQAQSAASSDDDIVDLEPFTVTGSHIPVTENAYDARTTPMTALYREDIDKLGYGTVTEMLQALTVNNGGSVPLANNGIGFTRGASSVSLRGLGPDSTLVLINGRRVTAFPIGDEGTTSLVDLNSIPAVGVDRIEVLTDGASAIYGADAIAGVVNLQTRRDYKGTELEVRYGDTTTSSANEFAVNLISGGSIGRASISGGLNYYHRNPIFARDRDYMENPPFLSSFSSPYNLQVTRAAVADALGQDVADPIPGVPDTSQLFKASTFNNRDSNNGELPPTDYQFSPGNSSFYNYNETAGSVPESERFGGFISFEIPLGESDDLRFYADIFYQNTETINELAPAATGPFSRPGVTPLVIPANTTTPIFTPTETANGQRSAAPGAFNPFNPFNQDLSGDSRGRFAEFGNRVYRDTNDAINVAAGFAGNRIFGEWDFDASVFHSRVTNKQHNSLPSISGFNRIVNAADSYFDPNSSEYSGTSVPYNPFGYYRNLIPNNELLVPLAQLELHNRNESETTGIGVTFTNGRLFEMPAGGAGFAVGAEYRWESLSQNPDPAGQSGDIVGSSPLDVTDADRKVASLFAELNLPIFSPEQQVPGAHSLSASLATRYEDFVDQGDSVLVPKLAFRWFPIDDSFVVRGSWGQGYRQPSLFEQYSSAIVSSFAPILNPATNVNEPEQSVTTASSPLVKAEDSDNLSIGAVWTPSFLKTDDSAFTVSADYWTIDRTGSITVDHQNVVDRFFAGAPLLPGEGVDLNLDGSISVVHGVFRNLGKEEAKGVDFSTSYFWNSDRFGRFDLGASASYLESLKRQQFTAAPAFEYVGWLTDVTFNNATGNPSPGTGDDAYLKWKGTVFANWGKGPVDVHVVGNYLDGYQDFTFDWSPANPTDPDGFRQVESTMIWDVSASYEFGQNGDGWLSDTQLRVGVNNVFNTDPPFVSSWGNNAVGYSGFLYIPDGRFVYTSLRKRF